MSNVVEEPRKRFISDGAATLTDAELLAMVLRTGAGRIDAVKQSENLIEHFGSISSVLCATPADLLKVDGMSAVKVAGVAAMRELVCRARTDEISGELLDSPAAVGDYLSLMLSGESREVFGIVMTDTRLRVLGTEHLFWGSINRCSVHTREVAKACFAANAAGVILYHNHPSGVLTPSPADLSITRKLHDELRPMDIDVVDHIIVGRLRSVSLKDTGHMNYY